MFDFSTASRHSNRADSVEVEAIGEIRSGTLLAGLGCRTMTFSISMTGLDFVQLSVAGELDAATAPDLKPSLLKLIERRPSQVAVDLSRLRMIDSNGVGTLVSFYKGVEAVGGAIVFWGLREQPLAVFRLLRLDRLMGDLQEELQSIVISTNDQT